MAQIKVTDELHTRLKDAAADNYRSIGGHIEFLMDFYAKNRGDVPYMKVGGTTPSAEVGDLLSETPPTPKNTDEKNFEGQAPVRTIPQILAEITSLSESRDEELEYCQDKEERTRIEREYGIKIQQLWDEYNMVKEA